MLIEKITSSLSLNVRTNIFMLEVISDVLVKTVFLPPFLTFLRFLETFYELPWFVESLQLQLNGFALERSMKNKKNRQTECVFASVLPQASEPNTQVLLVSFQTCPSDHTPTGWRSWHSHGAATKETRQTSVRTCKPQRCILMEPRTQIQILPELFQTSF